MAADVTVLGEVGDLILVIAELLQRLDGVEIHIRLCVVVGKIGAVLVLPEPRSRLGLEVDDVAQRLHPLLAALVRQAEHQIDGDIVEAGAARQHDGLLGLLVVVGPSERLELLVGVGLHADGDAVEARTPQARQHRQRHGIGIGLQCHLRVAADVEAPVDLGKNAVKAAGPDERLRAAAEVDRVHLIADGARSGLADVREHCAQIPVHQLLVARTAEGIKVAVFAFAAAERDMNIDPE